MRLVELRDRIPILEERDGGDALVYLDNAATTHKPREVIEAIENYYVKRNANIHRSPHRLGREATEAYERVRQRIKDVFNAQDYEVVFTRGATEALNIGIAGVALSKSGAIVSSEIDHHSSYVAAQQHARSHDREFRVLDIDNGFASLERIEGASLVSVPMVSNVTGEILNYDDVVAKAREEGAYAILDACQAAPHLLLDCDAVGADAYAFSAHKMLGPTGLGVLIAKREFLDSIEPLLYGGEMVERVSENETTFAHVPHRFEAGTMPIAQVISFGVALDVLSDLDRDEVEAHRKSTSRKLVEGLENLGATILSAHDDPSACERIPIVSVIGSFHPYDAALLLDTKGIATRAGHHCAEPFHRASGCEGSLRASAYLYTTSEEIDRFLETLSDVMNHA